jgi:tetratricopeptide (TPR) repeat protein
MKKNIIYQQALIKDIQSEYLEAVNLYEKSIAKNENSIDAYLNLAFIYWESNSQFVFSNGVEIAPSFSKININKYIEILDLGLIKFKNNREILFWKKYFRFASIGEEFSKKECEFFLKIPGESKIPYFFLYLFDSVRYFDERNEILAICKEMPTAKNNWIKSIIEN